VVAVGEIDAVEGAAMACADVLRHLEVVISVIARKPVVWQVVSVGKGSVAVDAQQSDHNSNFKPGQAFQFRDQVQRPIQYQA